MLKDNHDSPLSGDKMRRPRARDSLANSWLLNNATLLNIRRYRVSETSLVRRAYIRVGWIVSHSFPVAAYDTGCSSSHSRRLQVQPMMYARTERTRNDVLSSNSIQKRISIELDRRRTGKRERERKREKKREPTERRVTRIVTFSNCRG